MRIFFATILSAADSGKHIFFLPVLLCVALVLLAGCDQNIQGLSSAPELDNPEVALKQRSQRAGCLTQADCSANEVCFARRPGFSQCLATDNTDKAALAPGFSQSRQRPAPPVGLLTGDLRKK